MRNIPTTRAARRTIGGALAALSLITLSACGGDDGDSSTGAVEELGENEGEVTILAWPGYVEDGSTDPEVDWVSGFEEETGCQVTAKVYGTSDEAFNLAKSGEYDVVAASGDLTLRMIAAGEAAEVNTDLIPNYEGIYDFLKDREWNTVDDKNYGVPHGYGANLLMYNTDDVAPAPTSWKAVFEDAPKHKGQVTAYDSPIYIADAAVYLMAHQPDLGIENPYSLDEKQLAAAVDLLKSQRASVGEYWSDYTKTQASFETGDTVVGTTWQVIANLIDPKKASVEAILPSEGATGWNDTWMISSKAKSPNCAYAWLNHISDPEINAQATEYFGEAPNSDKACEFASEGHCETFHAGDEEYAEQIWFWNTPIEKCLDGRTDVKCTDYQDWTKAWAEIKG
ncbi:extracellular solute-binding protein [Nocardioides sp. NPDC058538]|uniref:extracellular solute-binding protein n=1 Tax=Nocardioides sp. NPDC058538 TaxID=3346542 RepID=UPI00365CE015